MARYRCKSKVIGKNNSNDLSFLNMVKSIVNVNSKVCVREVFTRVVTVPSTNPRLLMNANPNRIAVAFGNNAGGAQINLYVVGPLSNQIILISALQIGIGAHLNGPDWDVFLPMEWRWDEAGAPIDFDMIEYFSS